MNIIKFNNIENECVLKAKSISFTFLIAMVIICAAFKNTAAQCTPPFHPDYEALIAFYNAMDGDNWIDNSGWEDAINGLNCDPCNGAMFGIFCNSNDRVNRIDLQENNLVGSFPIEFFQITELTNLILRDNLISGELSPMFGDLILLEVIQLFNNQLTGEIPAEMGQLVNLEYFRLHNNLLTGTLPPELGMMSSLIYFDVYGNQLTGEIPPEFGQLLNLEVLLIYDNLFFGGIPIELTLLENLTILDLYGNEFSGEIPSEIGQLSNLEYLYFNSNGFTGEIPEEIYQITSLVHLYFDNNFLTGSISPNIGQLTELTRLSFANNFLSGSIPEEIGNLTSLVYAYFNHNQFSGEIPQTIGQLTSLDSLLFSSNGFTGELPAELGQLTNLVAFAIDSNQITGNIPIEIGQLSNLSFLNLSYNGITGEVPTQIGQLSNLQDLLLNNNQLQGCFNSELFNICSSTNVELIGNAKMPWQGDYSVFCMSAGDLAAQLNAPCDDGNTITENDAIDDSCNCKGDCTIYNITYSQNCEVDDALSIELDFEYASTSSTFNIELDGLNFGTFNYADLPILISPIDASPRDTLIFSIIDVEAGCNENFEVVELSCVWPGDANYDLTSNNYDVLNLGLTFNFTGPARDDQSTTWDGKAAESWAGAFVDSINHKHADTDGNGIINYADTTALLQNYNQIHNKTDMGFNEFTIDDPVLYVKLPDSTIVGGTYVEAPIVLGTNTLPVEELYGLAFTLEFDAGFIVENSVSITIEDSFLGDQSELIHIKQEITPEIFDIGICRNTHTNIGGFGNIGIIGFVVIEDLDGKREIDFQVNITKVKAISTSEKLVALNTEALTADVVSTTYNHTSTNANINIFPNPASDYLNISSQLQSTAKLFNKAGELILIESQKSNVVFDVSNLPNGIYLLLVEGDSFIKQQKIVISN